MTHGRILSHYTAKMFHTNWGETRHSCKIFYVGQDLLIS